jgi:DNA-binding transcriptional ArsR family regulator
MKAKPFLQLDRVIHEKGRLAIMSALAASPAMAFTELRDLLEMTDGNLTSHMRTLQEAGYVVVAKSFQNNRARLPQPRGPPRRDCRDHPRTRHRARQGPRQKMNATFERFTAALVFYFAVQTTSQCRASVCRLISHLPSPQKNQSLLTSAATH